MEWSAVAGYYPCTHTQVLNLVHVWRHKRVVVCVGKRHQPRDLSIENYPQTADVPATGDRPRLRSWFSPYKIYDVGGVWILDVTACSQHRVDQSYVYRRNVTAPPSMTARERRATCYHPIAGTSAVECSFLWSGPRLQAITHAHTHK